MGLRSSDLRGRAKKGTEEERRPVDISRVVKTLQESLKASDKKQLQDEIRKLKQKSGREVALESNQALNYVPIGDDLTQILESQTIERAKYYVKRLIKSLTAVKTNGINDINLYRWREYDEVITDSLWMFDRRDTSGSHLGWYWGNFVPQIPHQVILRFTKRGDWILDPFAGSGTTLIECIRLGRNGIGVEISQSTFDRTLPLLNAEPNRFGTSSILKKGDSTSLNFTELCRKNGTAKVQLVIMHPPYFDIIKFSKDAKDLSNAGSIRKFLSKLGKVVRSTTKVLQDGRYLVLVIGDTYRDGEWIPLGFYSMQEVMKYGYKLAGIITKNFDDTRGKRDQKELWRYRALAGGFYVFKHEYIFIFKKQKEKGSGADRV